MLEKEVASNADATTSITNENEGIVNYVTPIMLVNWISLRPLPLTSISKSEGIEKHTDESGAVTTSSVENEVAASNADESEATITNSTTKNDGAANNYDEPDATTSITSKVEGIAKTMLMNLFPLKARPKVKAYQATLIKLRPQ
jgi:hypothetical protein